MGAIKVHHTDTTEAAWDGPAMEARLKTGASESYYRQAFAWQDPEADPETKAAYKFIHHVVSADGEIGPADIKACQSGIGVLNGGMGGADIPSGDRQGVYDHLAAHLKDAGLEPADLRSMALDVERRTYPLAELRLIPGPAEGDPVKIRGYSAIFDKPSQDLGGFIEIVRRGAFSRSISTGADVRALFNHDPNYVLGRRKSGTLNIFEDDQGLGYEVEPPATAWARDLMTSIDRGDIDQGSFQFFTVLDEWRKSPAGIVTRELIDVELIDVSPVTFPAYVQTSAFVRSMAASLNLPSGQAAGGEDPEQAPGDPDRQAAEYMRRRLSLARRR